MKQFTFVTFLWLLAFFTSEAQSDVNYDWWNNRHGWDGISAFSDYMTFEPGAMGPNALPVPDMQNGKIDTVLSLTLASEIHTAKNDFTGNLFTKINIPIKKAVALQIWWVPLEYYTTDTIVRDFRAARTKNAKGYALGDVYIGMMIPVIYNKLGWPDVMLCINLKTASGNRLDDARYTDSPGYFFDISGGKEIAFKKNKEWKWRPYALGGFYVYQTNRSDYYQNDAIMWGIGCDVKNSIWKASVQFSGYSGYFNNLDQPAVLRLIVERKIKATTVLVRFQKGNSSYPFASIRAGIVQTF